MISSKCSKKKKSDTSFTSLLEADVIVFVDIKEERVFCATKHEVELNTPSILTSSSQRPLHSCLQSGRYYPAGLRSDRGPGHDCLLPPHPERWNQVPGGAEQEAENWHEQGKLW